MQGRRNSSLETKMLRWSMPLDLWYSPYMPAVTICTTSAIPQISQAMSCNTLMKHVEILIVRMHNRGTSNAYSSYLGPTTWQGSRYLLVPMP